MSNSEHDHFYYVDPGVGEKSKGCPYTFYADGHDVRSYIIPPAGYELTVFKLEPYPDDKFYDGKIVAQYKKIPISDTLKKNFMRYVLIFVPIMGILAIFAFLYFSYTNHSSRIFGRNKLKPKTEIKASPIDSTVHEQVSDTSSIASNMANGQTNNVEIAMEKTTENKTEVVKEEDASEEIESKSDSDSKPETGVTKDQFHKEFWDLIHRKENRMRIYNDLYRKYKNLNLKSAEYYYLYLTILKNGYAFDEWKAKLVNIPSDELVSVNTISALKQKIEEYNKHNN